MRAVNLLPSADTGESRSLPPLPVLVGAIGGVVVLGLLVVLFLSANGAVGTQKTALAQAQAVEAALPSPPAPAPGVAKLPAEQQARVSALADVLGQRVSWDRVLREISQVIPDDVSLQTLSATSPALTPPGTVATTGSLPTGFSVAGCTYSQDSVARFLARLELVPDLSDMTLGQSSTGSASPGDSTAGSAAACATGMTSFTLQGNVRMVGSAS